MKADLEMVATAVDALRVCGASRFHVELGHAGFFRDVAARMELEEGENTVEVPEGSTWMAVAAAGGGGAFTAQWES